MPEEFIIEIIKAGQFAPTARNNKAVEFIVIKDKETKNSISEIVGQEFVKEAPVLIVPVSDATKCEFWIQDLSVASENMFLQARALGLGTVWKNVRPEYEPKLKELLGIPERYRAVNVIPLGFSKTEPKPHTEEEFDIQKIHRGKW